MSRIKKVLGCGLMLAALAMPAYALAAEEGTSLKESDAKSWSVDLTLPYYSKYISRGAITVDDPVLQPGVTVAGYGFSFNVWGNYNLTDKIGKKNKFSEVDLTGEYAFEFGDFSFPLGVVHYLYPNMTQPNTTELYAGVSYKWIVTPTLKVYQDVGDVHGQLVNLTLAYPQELCKPHKDVVCSLQANAGLDWGSSDYNKYRYNAGVDESAFIDTSLTLGLPVKLWDALTVTPSYTHVFLMDSSMKDAFGYSDKGFWGLTLTYSF
jgi:hypothetical protein